MMTGSMAGRAKLGRRRAGTSGLIVSSFPEKLHSDCTPVAY